MLRALPRLRAAKGSRRLFTTARSSRDVKELDCITTLPNGVRVATEALPGHFSGLGVYVNAGSRYETDRLRGCSHIIDRLAFKSTSSRSASSMLESLERLGGNMQCASSRESIMYQSAVFNTDVPSMLGILAETVLDPVITQAEVEEQLQTAAYEISEIWAKPELILPELLHSTAFHGNTLGNPLLCPEERLQHITADTIKEYRKQFYTPERMVVAFAGVEHEAALKLAEKYFGHLPPSPAPGILSSLLTPKQAAHYTGGLLTMPPSTAPTHLPSYFHLHLAFEGLPITDPDVYALAVLQTLLGGGGSFSAGGPGKGMYSRIYTNVLNHHGWIESAVTFNHSYTDSGLFGIAATCHPEAGHALINVLLKEFQNLMSGGYKGLDKEEVERAKNQLRSSLLMNLESRMVELEDLGRQVQVYGRRVSAQEMSEEIQKLKVEDIRRVAERVLKGGVHNPGKGKGGPTVVVQGTDKAVQDMGDILGTVRAAKLGR
ncbi:Metalloenzyme, LuxS/M16 peptidase-like protein [Pyronema omphalodes]|nr:Metalloenzyme, LuxS/M16 peptidase-like protein [Pyronema omphalodes]